MEKSKIDSHSPTRIAADPDALEIFYRAYFDRVVAFVSRRCSSPEDVADVVADVFVEAIRSAGRFDPSRGEPLGWLLGIASNLLASSRRARRRQRELESILSGRQLLESDDYSRLESRIDAARLAAALERALRHLSDRERALIELVHVEGLSALEAANALRVGPGHARMMLTRARRKLLRRMGADPWQTGSRFATQEGDNR